MTKDENFVIDCQSPYYLHPSDGPGAIITSIKLDGNNYELWNMAVTTAVMAKNKLDIQTGTCEASSKEERVEHGEFNDHLVDSECYCLQAPY